MSLPNRAEAKKAREAGLDAAAGGSPWDADLLPQGTVQHTYPGEVRRGSGARRAASKITELHELWMSDLRAGRVGDPVAEARRDLLEMRRV